MTSWWTFGPGLKIKQTKKSNTFVQERSLKAMCLICSSRLLLYNGSHQLLILLNKMRKLNAD